MYKTLLLAVSSTTVLLAVGCSTITTGTTQPIIIETAKVSGAKCELTDSKSGRWVVSDTPETVEITKGDGPLTVSCKKSGYKDTKVIVEEGFAGMTLGNVILGGGIGVIVDAASGAAQEYPDRVMVWMEPNSFSSTAAKAEWFKEKEAYEAELQAKKNAAKQQSNDNADKDGYN
jgi:hypothetical protein